jgi:hypothetical protein
MRYLHKFIESLGFLGGFDLARHSKSLTRPAGPIQPFLLGIKSRSSLHLQLRLYFARNREQIGDRSNIQAGECSRSTLISGWGPT